MFKTAKQQIAFIAIAIILTAFSLASIINFTDPYKASLVTFTFLYISLFLCSLGIFTLLGLALRQWLATKIFVLNLSNSFRQAIILSFLLTLSLVLQGQKLLFWWVEASLILFFLSIEVFLNLKI